MIPNATWLFLALVAVTAACSSGNTPADAGADTPVDTPPSCAGENPSRACRTTQDECIPSSCSCSENGWACTADCGGGRACGDAGSDAEADAERDADRDAEADAGPDERCRGTGGTVRTSLCCQATLDFPNSCLVGACGCAPIDSHSVSVCACPANTCFTPDRGCVVAMACTPGADQTCNDDPLISSIHGRCQIDHTCVCDFGPGLNPATGRCL